MGIHEMYTRKVLVRKEINEELGIGVGLSSDKQKKVIRKVNRGSPGHKAGLNKGDIIVQVEDFSCEESNIDEVFLILNQQMSKKQFTITVRTKHSSTNKPLLGDVGDSDDEDVSISGGKKCQV